MSAAKEIRNKIKSVQNTQKITKAMEMVAASKMRRAQERMRHARPYAEKIREVCAHLARANSEVRHPFLHRAEETKTAGIIVVSTDKGLCGGLNAGIFRMVTARLKEWDDNGIPAKLTVFGNKGAAFLSRFKAEIISREVGYGDAPSATRLVGAVKVMLDAYRRGEVGEVHLAYSKFVNTVKQEPQMERLLPIPPESVQKKRQFSWDYLYEPEAPPIVDLLLTRYVEALIYQSAVENIASEQAARMVAMKAASDNAGSLIDELQLAYNKSRQAAITQEIAEIVGGAAAV